MHDLDHFVAVGLTHVFISPLAWGSGSAAPLSACRYNASIKFLLGAPDLPLTPAISSFQGVFALAVAIHRPGKSPGKTPQKISLKPRLKPGFRSWLFAPKSLRQ